MRCCGTRPDDGVVDREAIERAARGQYAVLTRTERELTIALMARRQRMGLKAISQQLNYSRSQTAEILRRHRLAVPE